MIDAATARCINDDLASMLEAFEGFDLASNDDGEFGPYGNADLPYRNIHTIIFETKNGEISRSNVSHTILPAISDLRRDARHLTASTPIIAAAHLISDDDENILRLRLDLAVRASQSVSPIRRIRLAA